MTEMELARSKLKLELFRIDFRDEQRMLQELCDMLDCNSWDLVKEVKKLKERVKAWEAETENTDQQVADLAERVRLFEKIMAFKED